jgi:predicted transglutaminase-like cysteine proteinase
MYQSHPKREAQALTKDKTNHKLSIIIFMKIFLFVLLFFIATTSINAKDPYVEKPLLDKIEQKYKIFAKKRFFYQQKTFDSLEGATDLEKLDKVNTFYNGVKYMSDLKVYGQKDYWATPWEFLGKDKGDCEDYTISKYFALIYLGVDAKKLFFTYVRSSEFTAAHMVLTYFETPRSEPLILDNNNHKVLKASLRKDLTPVYNFNGESLYKASSKGTGQKVESQKVHKKWDELLLNMQKKKI